MSWPFRTSIDSDLEEIDTDLPEHCTVVILGTGPAGLDTGIRLVKAGRGDFVLLEQAIGVSETVRRRAHACGVWQHIRFGTDLRHADWDAVHSWWRLRTTRGTMTTNFLVLAADGTTGVVRGRDGRPLQPPGPTVPGFPNLFIIGALEEVRLVSGGLNLFARKRIREFEVRVHAGPTRRPSTRFHPHDYHLTVGQPRPGDPAYREVEKVPRPSAVGAGRLAP